MDPSFNPVGQCIYCGATSYAPGSDRPLAPEHIVPFGLSGYIELPEASCRKCERITGNKIEGAVLRGQLLGPRAAMGLKSRKKGLSSPRPLFVGEDEKTKIHLPPEDCPAVLLLPFLPDPAILWALEGWGIPAYDHPPFIHWFNYKPQVLRQRYGITRAALPWMNTVAFCRMIAKIGHAWAVANLGVGGFRPLLNEMLMDDDLKSRAILPFVGGEAPTAPGTGFHSLKLEWGNISGVRLLLAHVRLFSKLGSPNYLVVVGTDPAMPAPQLPSCSVSTDALHNYYRIDARVD